MNILLASILFVLFVQVSLFLIYLLSLKGVLTAMQDFITPQEEDKPSEVAKAGEIFADMIGRSVAAQGKATLMGMQSGQVRGEKAVMADIAEDTARSSPLGAILDSFPTLKKSIRRNPGLLDIALGVLQKKSNSNHGKMVKSGGSPRFRL